jgi:hypothetical protein
MQLSGMITEVLPLQSGEGRIGMWKKRAFILQNEGRYPRPVCISIWGELIDRTELREGDQVTADINIESRQYNDRWYTEVKAWKVEVISTTTASSQQPPTPPLGINADDDEGLPF